MKLGALALALVIRRSVTMAVLTALLLGCESDAQTLERLELELATASLELVVLEARADSLFEGDRRFSAQWEMPRDRYVFADSARAVQYQEIQAEISEARSRATLAERELNLFMGGG